MRLMEQPYRREDGLLKFLGFYGLWGAILWGALWFLVYSIKGYLVLGFSVRLLKAIPIIFIFGVGAGAIIGSFFGLIEYSHTRADSQK